MWLATGDGLRDTFESSRQQIERLARTSEMLFVERAEFPKASAREVLATGAELAIPLEGLIDFAQERARRERQRTRLQDESMRLGAQLARADFLDRAPAEKVNEIKSRRDELAVQLAAIDRQLEALS